MKKLILALILITGIVKGQNPSAYVTIRAVTDTVYTGDSLKINFTYSVNSTPCCDVVQIMIHNGFYSQNCLNTGINNLSMYGVMTDLDGTKYLKVKITPAMGTGYTRIIANQNEKPTFIKTPSVIGIEEHFMNSKAERKYYDLMGNEIQKRFNELIIEQVGDYRRKIYIE